MYFTANADFIYDIVYFILLYCNYFNWGMELDFDICT